MKEPLAYLACPFSHPDRRIRFKRYRQCCEVTAALMRLGVLVFSPLAHSVMVHEKYRLPDEWEFWRRIDFAFLDRCTELLVLTLPGWEESVGVQAELARARARGMRITFIAGCSAAEAHWPWEPGVEGSNPSTQTKAVRRNHDFKGN